MGFFVIISFFFFSGRSHQQIFSGRCFWNCPSKPFMKPCWDLFKRGRLAYAKCTPNQVVSEKKHMQLHTGLAIHLTIYSWEFPWKMLDEKVLRSLKVKTTRCSCCSVCLLMIHSSKGPKDWIFTDTATFFHHHVHPSIHSKTPLPQKEQKISKHGDHHPNVNKKYGIK